MVREDGWEYEGGFTASDVEHQVNAARIKESLNTNSESSGGNSISPALWFAMTYPFILTAIYFVLLNGEETGLQNWVFSNLKLIQFAFPAVFVFLVCRESLSLPLWKKPAFGFGLGFGALIIGAAIAIYFGLLKDTLPYYLLRGKVQAKVQGFGLTSVWAYGAFSVFYCLIHSGMEEYYWRWFVFKRLRTQIGECSALVLSSIAFMSHHVILMVVFFGLTSPLAWSFSLCVAVGGGVWAWLYNRSDNFYAIWASHALVDAAIFMIGYDLIFN
jgi:membrane protease YdiL (CAAX protease family)